MRTVALWLAGGLVASAAHAGDRDFDRKVAADPHGTVEISDVSGVVDVSAWDNPEVEVHGNMGSGVDRIDVTSEHGRTLVKVVLPNYTFGGAGVDLRVRVPRDSSLEISTVSADVVSEQVQGAQRLKTVSGNVKADIFQQSLEIKTVSGNVALRGRGDATVLRISTVSGNVKVERGGGDLETTTISGNVNAYLDTARTVRVRTTSGDLNFEGKLSKGGNIDAETVSGRLNVRANPQTGYSYEIGTFSGDIRNCFGAQAEKTSQYGPGKRLNGSRGASADAGGADVRLKTMSGDIELCDRT